MKLNSHFGVSFLGLKEILSETCNIKVSINTWDSRSTQKLDGQFSIDFLDWLGCLFSIPALHWQIVCHFFALYLQQYRGKNFAGEKQLKQAAEKLLKNFDNLHKTFTSRVTLGESWQSPSSPRCSTLGCFERQQLKPLFVINHNVIINRCLHINYNKKQMTTRSGVFSFGAVDALQDIPSAICPVSCGEKSVLVSTPF